MWNNRLFHLFCFVCIICYPIHQSSIPPQNQQGASIICVVENSIHGSITDMIKVSVCCADRSVFVLKHYVHSTSTLIDFEDV